MSTERTKLGGFATEDSRASWRKESGRMWEESGNLGEEMMSNEPQRPRGSAKESFRAYKRILIHKHTPVLPTFRTRRVGDRGEKGEGNSREILKKSSVFLGVCSKNIRNALDF